MNRFKKSLISFSIFLFQFSIFFALPAITPSVPDFSGQYVYYRDTSFERESYIGIVYYDESTYGLRYYAPAVKTKKDAKPEKSIYILFTIDSKKENLELTGERILSAITPEDTDLVNYIHDFIYEMTKRRQNAGEVTAPKSEYQDYEQFGGSVTMIYDCRIPLFNIFYIEGQKSKKLMECITIGQLKSSFDKSFEDFKGFPNNGSGSQNSKNSKAKKNKAKSVKYSFENQKITLDSDWNQAMENLWLLGNDSVITLSTIPAFDKEDETRNESYIMRRILGSIQGAYTNFTTLSISKGGNIKITFNNFHSDNGKTVCTTMILSKKKDTSDFDIFTISTYEKPWSENPSYFQKIIKSYSN